MKGSLDGEQRGPGVEELVAEHVGDRPSGAPARQHQLCLVTRSGQAHGRRARAGMLLRSPEAAQARVADAAP
jgi:hypothetical protein